VGRGTGKEWHPMKVVVTLRREDNASSSDTILAFGGDIVFPSLMGLAENLKRGGSSTTTSSAHLRNANVEAIYHPIHCKGAFL